MISPRLKLNELTLTETKTISGGNVISDIGYGLGYITGLLAKPFYGAYEKGYDEACECN